MNKHRTTFTSSEISVGAISRAISAAVDVAERTENGRQTLGTVLCAALDTVGGGAPGYTAFGNIREDARWWADCATPVEIEIYLAVCLRRLNELNGRGLAERARKRVFMALWQSMDRQDQKAFLNKVKPP